MKRGIDGARRMPRANTLRDNQPVNNNRIPFVVTFHPALPNIGEILHRLHPVLKSSRRCQSAIEQMPMVAFMRPKRKKDKIKRSRLLHNFFSWNGHLSFGHITVGSVAASFTGLYPRRHGNDGEGTGLQITLIGSERSDLISLAFRSPKGSTKEIEFDILKVATVVQLTAFSYRYFRRVPFKGIV